ncbi:hypothetical protein IKQ21_00270 [bacterium]|nr:hypothetical protein [bacterium]
MLVDKIQHRGNVQFGTLQLDSFSSRILRPIQKELTKVAFGQDVIITRRIISERVPQGFITDNSLIISVGKKPVRTKNSITNFFCKMLGLEYPERNGRLVLKRTLHKTTGEEDVLENNTKEGILQETKRILQHHISNFYKSIYSKKLNKSFSSLQYKIFADSTLPDDNFFV